MNDLQKIMAQNAEILTRLEALDHLLRSLWEDPQLDRIEELARLQSAFQQQNWAAAGGQSPEWTKPAPASPADPQVRRTGRA